MEGQTQDQFTVNHLRRRISEITLAYEDRLVVAAVQLQLISQERNALRAQVQSLESKLVQEEPLD